MGLTPPPTPHCTDSKELLVELAPPRQARLQGQALTTTQTLPEHLPSFKAERLEQGTCNPSKDHHDNGPGPVTTVQ